jgi:hypothetical protein
MSTFRRYLIRIGSLIWLTGIIASYYLYHKPIQPGLILNLIGASWEIAVAFGTVSISAGLGWRLLKRAEVPEINLQVVAPALGMGLVSIFVLLVGAVIGLQNYLWWAIFVVLGVILRRDILAWFSGWRALSSVFHSVSKFGKILVSFSILIAIVTLTTALSPALKFDALVYHLALPRAYIEAGKVTYVSWNMFWGMPQVGEMLYTFVMALSGEAAACVLGWIAGMLALVGIAGFLAWGLNSDSGVVASASLLAGFSLSAALAWAYVDWLAILFGWAFFISLDEWRRNGSRQALILSGIFAGFAFGTKYTAGVLLPAGAVALFWMYKDPAQRRFYPKHLATFGFSFFLISLPWFIKNILATGNPFYPLFFPSGSMDALRLDLYQGGTPWGNWLDVFFLPFRSVFLGVELTPGYSSSIGPLLLGFAVLAVLPNGDGKGVDQGLTKLAGWITIPTLMLWAIAGRFSNYLLQSRLYYAAFPAIAILAGIGFYKLAKEKFYNVRFRRIAVAVVLLVFGLNVIEIGLNTLRTGAFQLLAGLQTEDQYLANNLGWFSLAAKTVRELPPGKRTLMLWEPRSLYCLPNCVPDEVLDRWLHDLSIYGTPTSVLGAWRQAGFSYLLFNQQGADFIRQEDGRYQSADWEALDALLTKLELVQGFGEDYRLYSLIQ